VALGEEAAPLVELQHDIHGLRVGHERHLELGDAARVARWRRELDLLVEGQLLVHPVDAALLAVGLAEPEAQAGEGGQDALLRGQRVHGDGVQVGGVHGARDLHLGGEPHGRAVQRLPVEVGQRRLTREVEPERDRASRSAVQCEGAGDRELRVLEVGAVLVVARLDLDARPKGEEHAPELGVVVAALEGDLPGDDAARQRVGIVQHGLDLGAADPQCLHQLLEHHGVTFPCRARASPPGAFRGSR
jgi:hypothetical protein